MEGITLPSKFRVYPRDPDKRPAAEPLIVGLDLFDYRPKAGPFAKSPPRLWHPTMRIGINDVKGSEPVTPKQIASPAK